jgi:hypothetical protein
MALMPDLFISYLRRDKVFVKRFIKSLVESWLSQAGDDKQPRLCKKSLTSQAGRTIPAANEGIC